MSALRQLQDAVILLTNIFRDDGVWNEDEQKPGWYTTETGAHYLVGQGGVVIAGMGGKATGKTIKEFAEEQKDKTWTGTPHFNGYKKKVTNEMSKIPVGEYIALATKSGGKPKIYKQTAQGEWEDIETHEMKDPVSIAHDAIKATGKEKGASGAYGDLTFVHTKDINDPVTATATAATLTSPTESETTTPTATSTPAQNPASGLSATNNWTPPPNPPTSPLFSQSESGTYDNIPSNALKSGMSYYHSGLVKSLDDVGIGTTVTMLSGVKATKNAQGEWETSKGVATSDNIASTLTADAGKQGNMYKENSVYQTLKTAAQTGDVVDIPATLPTKPPGKIMKGAPPPPVPNYQQFGTDAYEPSVKSVAKHEKTYEGSTDAYFDEGQKQFNDLNPTQKNALVGNTGHYRYMNDPVRYMQLSKSAEDPKDVPVDQHTYDQIKACQDALSQCRFTEARVIPRSVDSVGAARMMKVDTAWFANATEAELNAALVGVERTDESMQSCKSYGNVGAMNNEVHYVLYCPEGTQGVYADGYSQFSGSGECETVLQSGTTIRVTKVKRPKGGKPTIFAEVIKQDPDEVLSHLYVDSSIPYDGWANGKTYKVRNSAGIMIEPTLDSADE
jgi:hypothetical protein